MSDSNTGTTHQLPWDPDLQVRLARLQEIWDVMEPGDVVAETDARGMPVFYDVVADPTGQDGVTLKHVLSGPGR